MVSVAVVSSHHRAKAKERSSNMVYQRERNRNMVSRVSLSPHHKNEGKGRIRKWKNSKNRIRKKHEWGKERSRKRKGKEKRNRIGKEQKFRKGMKQE